MLNPAKPEKKSLVRLNMDNKNKIRLVFLSIILFLFVIPVSGISAQKRKIAVPANSSEKDSLISQEMGRAQYFLFFDDRGQFISALKNPASSQTGGISRTVITLLTDNQITTVIADSVGTKMKKALTDHNIELIKKSGAAQKAVTVSVQH
ncbi:hypothetical protein UWK_03205 [Desulfocapsa sulfexigens DSM 10523]|uniref:Dinitrogenase iron-molybdenum cofactor biosynthesis domain-containing protein n=1 Tax=Desulfocapsa sulfexigens (strain DSM 10523 / SB164P1) TaxID=1167006 RepID=M1PDR5_DESSD|nr:NifB/NifX family molybdenum-iron cluster-binding protein [Desulfocapsa sulfexigens]AGF79732.1 hypothetical protein UWK_03205 [Desulfocapsa sulfexigens DSM 10523]